MSVRSWFRSAPRRAALRDGALAVAPSLAGTASWGLVTGIALVKSGLSTAQALGMAALVFSGTAQLASVPLIAAGASIPVIALTVVLTNLRFVIYSASLARDLGRLPLVLRLLLGYLTSDTGLASYQMRRGSRRPEPQRVALFLGASFPVYVVWQIGTIGGIVAAGLLPPGQAHAYLGILAIVALSAAMLRGAPALLAALVSIGIALIGRDWPYKLGMFGAVLAGIAAAMLAEAWLRRRASARNH